MSRPDLVPPPKRRPHQNTVFTRVRDKETGAQFSAPYAADKLPAHLEALDKPALDRNGYPLPAKHPVKLGRRLPPTPKLDVAKREVVISPADQGQPTEKANEEATS